MSFFAALRIKKDGLNSERKDVKIKTMQFGTPRVRVFHLRSDLHVLRKLWHVLMGSMIAFLYLGGIGRWVGVAILLAILGMVLSLETLRFRYPVLNERICRAWGPLMRECETRQMSGVPPYLFSCILVIAALPKTIAVLSILFLACGDPIASFFGVSFGRFSHRFKNGKSVIGTLAGVLTCMFLSALFLATQTNVSEIGWAGTTAFVTWGGLVGGTVELLPLEVDDNFTIPVISGFLVWAAALVLGLHV